MDELREISNNISGPWCAIRDFNALLNMNEKDGGRSDAGASVFDNFQDCLSDCGLEDVGFRGNPFTWHRGTLRERLDRAVVNIQWRVRFEEATLFHWPNFKSDHVPLLM